MYVTAAMLPDVEASQDRVLTTSSAVIVLDGASAFIPVEVSPATYADTLGRFLIEYLTAAPEADLADALEAAIERAKALLDLDPGASPSSTVAIARQRADDVDLLVLGDTQIATPSGTYLDERIGALAGAQRAAYRKRLLQGHGYDDMHRELLRELQREQARHRNRDGGYWIAEAVPEAASHAMTTTLPVASTPWLVLATDGAYKPMSHLGLDDWAAVAKLEQPELHHLLKELHRWEAEDDPNGIALPRAKRHDDKALVTVMPRTGAAEA